MRKGGNSLCLYGASPSFSIGYIIEKPWPKVYTNNMRTCNRKTYLLKPFLFLLFMTLSRALFAVPFGSLVAPESLSSGTYKNDYLINKISNNQPVSICVDGRLDKYSLSKEQIDAALNSWFRHTRQAVSNAGRDEEFADLKSILSNGADIHLQNCVNDDSFKRTFGQKLEKGSSALNYEYASSKEDLRIILVDQSDIASGRSFFSEKHNFASPYIVLNMQDKRGHDGLDVLRHELGHALSLSDQYPENRLNSVPEYGTSNILPSMMNGGKEFTCDDVDGLIFALDCVAQKNTSRGGQEGWRSFCPQRAGRNYAYCKAKNRETLLWMNKEKIRFARYDQSGRLLEKKEWNRSHDPFFSYPKGIPFVPLISSSAQNVYKDENISYIKSSNGECILSRPQGEHKEKSEETLIVCAAPNRSEALVVTQPENGFVETDSDESYYFSLEINEEKERRVNVSYGREGFTAYFVYTPTFRLEYMASIEGLGEQSEMKDMKLFLFLKGSPVYYAFLSYDEDSPWVGAAVEDTEASSKIRFITKEAREKIFPYVEDFIEESDFDTQSVLLSHELIMMKNLGGGDRYRDFLDGSVQNGVPGGLDGGFLFSE